MLCARSLILLTLTALLGGCASTGMTITERAESYDKYIAETKLNEIERIRSFDFHGWQRLSNRHLIISSRFNRPYLVELRSKCVDLYHANGIIINNAGSTVVTKLDTISVLDGLPQRCRIQRIFELSKAERKAVFEVTKPQES